MTSYNRNLAYELAQHAVAIYDLSNGYERWTRGMRFVGADTVERGATQVGIAYSVDRIIVAARGSSQLGDWLDNFLPFRLGWKTVQGRIHLGFRIQAIRAAQEVLETVKDLRAAYPNAKVYVTGHSLGGALATLLRCVIEAGGIPVEAVYTFESPRVGNSTWAQWYDVAYGENSFRVVNINQGEQDIVTRVPLSRLGWRHVGRPVILSGGNAFESESAWEAHRRSNPVGFLSHLRIVRNGWLSVAAHLSAGLLRELKSQTV